MEACFVQIRDAIESAPELKEYQLKLYRYGSSVNGLATNTGSDLDLTLLVSNFKPGTEFHNELLGKVRRILEKKFKESQDKSIKFDAKL
jgi:predicted nucleotidyltransferase